VVEIVVFILILLEMLPTGFQILKAGKSHKNDPNLVYDAETSGAKPWEVYTFGDVICEE